MIFKDLEKALTEVVIDLKPAPAVPADAVPFSSMDFDRSETDNTKWIKLITGYLHKAETFEIHCWNEEPEWIALALQYGEVKNDDWTYGTIITGKVTPSFIAMLLGQHKPADTEIYNKMTPFFSVFLDDVFQSCHYGTENFYKSLRNAP